MLTGYLGMSTEPEDRWKHWDLGFHVVHHFTGTLSTIQAPSLVRGLLGDLLPLVDGGS